MSRRPQRASRPVTVGPPVLLDQHLYAGVLENAADHLGFDKIPRPVDHDEFDFIAHTAIVLRGSHGGPESWSV